MKFIEREHIDCKKWDKLVERSGGLPFSTSVYLDAVAENWCVLVDRDYTSGIALPYVVRLGKRSVYTPLFLRCLEWVGGEPSQNLIDKIKEHFPKGDLSIRNNLDVKQSKLVYQEIDIDVKAKYNEQAKRMIRKFDGSKYAVFNVDTPKHILEIISEELPAKVNSVNQRSIKILEKLVKSYRQAGKINMIEVRAEGECVGGAFFLEDEDRIIYLKSAFRSSAKKSGAMYKIMDTEIQKALTLNKVFDFGGSRVDGVRRFNLNLGGKDHVYYSCRWDNMPFWYKGLKVINDKLRK